MAICGTPLSMPDLSTPRQTEDRAGRGWRLPFEVVPADWLRWPGRRRAPGFRLTADALTVLDGGAGRSIPLAAVTEVHLDGGCLQVVLRSGDRWELAPGPHPEDALALVARVVTEYRQWESWRAVPLSPAATLEAIDRLTGSLAEPWVRATELLLALAVGSGASDLHLEPLPGCTRVTLRGAGGLTEAGSFRAAAHAGVIARLKHLAGCHPHLTGIPQEGAWTIDDAAGIEGRLAVFPSLDGERAAVRLVRPLQFPDLEALGWPAVAVAAWRSLLAEGPGLLLLTGPVGSGKTTALYATLAELAAQPGGEGSGRPDASPAPAGAWSSGEGRARRRVVTLEDPVEGRVPGICQASLDPRAGLDLAGAFKHLLRQDPDVMALGEIRDPDCLRQVLQAGLAGHLVLATFHAASPAAALDRLRQMGAAPDLLASGLRGLVGLRWATAGTGAGTATADQSSRRPRPAVSVVRLDPAAPAGALRLLPMTDPPEVSA